MQVRKAAKDDISKIVDLTQRAWEGVTMAQLLEKRYGMIENKRWYQYKGQEIRNFCQNNLDRALAAKITRTIHYSQKLK